MDILRRILESGVEVRKFVPSYGNAPNEVESVTKCELISRLLLSYLRYSLLSLKISSSIDHDLWCYLLILPPGRFQRPVQDIPCLLSLPRFPDSPVASVFGTLIPHIQKKLSPKPRSFISHETSAIVSRLEYLLSDKHSYVCFPRIFIPQQPL